METNTSFVALSENEFVVRTFKCTKIRRFLVSPANGFLSVTNKRLVYFSEGKSVNGSNTLITEMPLEDVAGISTALGISLNWLIFVLVCFILYTVTSLLTEILPSFLTGWVISILLVLPYVLSMLFEKNILNQDLREKALQKLDETPLNTFLKQKDSSFYTGLFQILFYVGLALLAWNLSHRTSLRYNAPFLGNIILLGAYFLIYIVFIGRQRSFSLRITSKTAKSNGIYIPGNFLSALLSGSSPIQSMNSRPDEDAEVIVKDLGAIIMDIQQLGGLGIKKWMEASSEKE